MPQNGRQRVKSQRAQLASSRSPGLLAPVKLESRTEDHEKVDFQFSSFSSMNFLAQKSGKHQNTRNNILPFLGLVLRSLPSSDQISLRILIFHPVIGIIPDFAPIRRPQGATNFVHQISVILAVGRDKNSDLRTIKAQLTAVDSNM